MMMMMKKRNVVFLDLEGISYILIKGSYRLRSKEALARKVRDALCSYCVESGEGQSNEETPTM
jgi:hypothetical protein